jgi:hypothetical protein
MCWTQQNTTQYVLDTTKHNTICVGHNKTQHTMCWTQQNTTQYVLDTTKHNTICVGHNKTQYVLDTTKHNTICDKSRRKMSLCSEFGVVMSVTISV